ncbi:hypothetical protein IT575_01095 [bacterium]|nr:hypothetical protein [bacterium]
MQMLQRLDARRGPSFSQAEGYKDGADYAAALPSSQVSVNGPELQFSPLPGAGGLEAMAYAVWDFTLPAPDSGLLINLLWEVPPGAGHAWLALGNFASGRWDWQRLENLDEASIADAAAYYGPADRLLLAIAVSDDSGVSLRSIQLYSGAAPLAVLQLSPGTVDVGEEVVMDGSFSSDPEGSIVRYEWDSDGDGSFETDGGAISAYSTYPAQPGTLSLGLRVTDASGQTATASQSLIVQPFGAAQTLDSASPSGLYTSLAVVNGRPAVATWTARSPRCAMCARRTAQAAPGRPRSPSTAPAARASITRWSSSTAGRRSLTARSATLSCAMPGPAMPTAAPGARRRSWTAPTLPASTARWP